jgi:hypothetical protein
MKLQKVMRYDPAAKLFRVARLIWNRGNVGDGQGYSNKLSVALTPRIFRFKRESFGWIATLAGIRIHYCRSYGGIFA